MRRKTKESNSNYVNVKSCVLFADCIDNRYYFNIFPIYVEPVLPKMYSIIWMKSKLMAWYAGLDATGNFWGTLNRILQTERKKHGQKLLFYSRPACA